MKRYSISTVVLLAACLTLSAFDGGHTLQLVRVNDLDLSREDDRMNVEFVLDFSAVELGRNQQVIYTPVLSSADGTQQAVLGKIVLNGRNMSILEARSPKTRVPGTAQTVRRINGTEQSVAYRTTVAYSAWMDASTLYLSEDVCGCGDLQAQDRVELASYRSRPDFRTGDLAVYVEPEIEQPKIRHEKGRASVDFAVNDLVIRPEFRNNRAEIDKIVSTIDVVRNDANVEITGIEIHGYASPEDTWEHNAYLAEHRTRALKDYVAGLYDLPADLFTAGSTPEDWEGLRAQVAASDLPHRAELLAVIDDPSLTPDTKDWRMKLNYSSDYAVLLETVFPSLRRSEYTVSYIVRPFTAEEALEVLKVSPGQVSLYEMFWAARSLGVNTEGYNEVIDLAVKTYPEEPAANYNAAVVAVNRGDYEKALHYLDKVPESGKTLNVRGVIALNRGDYDAARALFRQAAAQDVVDAARNLEILDRVEAVK